MGVGFVMVRRKAASAITPYWFGIMCVSCFNGQSNATGCARQPRGHAVNEWCGGGLSGSLCAVGFKTLHQCLDLLVALTRDAGGLNG